MNTDNAFTRPEKPFMLISQLSDGNIMVTWHETEDDLIWLAKNNTATTTIAAIEIASCRDVKLDIQ